MDEATKEDWMAAIDKVGEAVDSARSARSPGGAQRLHRGPDQRQRRRLDRLVRRRLPDRQTTSSGAGLERAQPWFDMMSIPAGAPNTAAALEFMNFAYEPGRPGRHR